MYGCARLAVLQQFEYRFNFIVDAIVQPTIVSLVELTLWIAFFGASGTTNLIGFEKAGYLSYALWAAFISRISTSWMYEMRMSEDVESGTVNSILTRPISFYEFYLGQLIGYKLLITAISIFVPAILCWLMGLPVLLERLPAAIGLVFYYLILVHTISVLLASLGFFLTRIHHLTFAKNICFWMLTGELFPLDLAPEPFKSFFIALPFSSAVFRPVGYLTGRLEISGIWEGFVSVTLGLLVFGLLTALFWNAGRRRYSGTGA
jgi:ABC-2 type transport system permease protein